MCMRLKECLGMGREVIKQFLQTVCSSGVVNELEGIVERFLNFF